jgi:hypothetical protein
MGKDRKGKGANQICDSWASPRCLLRLRPAQTSLCQQKGKVEAPGAKKQRRFQVRRPRICTGCCWRRQSRRGSWCAGTAGTSTRSWRGCRISCCRGIWSRIGPRREAGRQQGWKGKRGSRDDDERETKKVVAEVVVRIEDDMIPFCCIDPEVRCSVGVHVVL